MRRNRIRLSFGKVGGALLLPAATRAGETKSNPSWEKMKTLVGDWQGTAGE